jgi:hypothetical protein
MNRLASAQVTSRRVVSTVGVQTGDGWHQAIWQDWRGDWWWGPCVPIDELVALGGPSSSIRSTNCRSERIE